MLQVRCWKYLWYVHRRFSYESPGERILKFGPHLPKLLTNIKWLSVLRNSVCIWNQTNARKENINTGYIACNIHQYFVYLSNDNCNWSCHFEVTCSRKLGHKMHHNWCVNKRMDIINGFWFDAAVIKITQNLCKERCVFQPNSLINH